LTIKLKLLFLAHHKKEIGAYVRAYHLARQLSIRGHEVTLITVSPNSKFKIQYSNHDNLKIIETPNFLHSTFFSLRLWIGDGTGPLDIFARLKEGTSHQYDILHTFDHYLNISIPFYFLKYIKKQKTVSDWCDLFDLPGGLRETYGFKLDYIYNKINFPFRFFNRFMELNIRKKSDYVSVISEKLKEIAIESGIDGNKIALVEGGVDINLIVPLPKLKYRKKFNLPTNGRIICFMGRHQEDLDIVISSFTLLYNEIPDLYLMIIGKPVEKNKILTSKFGISDNYIEVGRCSDEELPHYLACADIFVLPYKNNLANEARWANKFGEYLAAARPIVISNVGDQAEIVKEYKVGLVAENTTEDFALKMKQLLSNKQLLIEYGENARNLACEKYSWKKMVDKLEIIYSEIIK